MPTTTLIIIHPRELLRLGLLSVFKGQVGFKVLGQGSTGKEAQKLTKIPSPRNEDKQSPRAFSDRTTICRPPNSD